MSKTSSRSKRTVSPGELWRYHGAEDVYYQRESQTTWWTILGGVAVAALLSRLESIWTLVLGGKWYYLLYVTTSALIILLAWLQISWGVLIIRWRITLAHTLWVYSTGFVLSIMSLTVSNISIWWITVAAMATISNAIQLYFSRTGAWHSLPDDAQARILKGLSIYWGYIGMSVAGSLFTFYYPSDWIKLVFGFLGLFSVVLALYKQRQGMEYERELLGIP